MQTLRPISLLIIFLMGCVALFAQKPHHSANALPYHQIYAYGLDANVSPILALLEAADTALTDKDRHFKTAFEKRFKGSEDESSFLEDKASSLNELLAIFRDYWRAALLDTSRNYEPELAMKVIPFLQKNYPPVQGINITKDSLGTYVSRYIKSKGLYTTDAAGKTGRLFDLLVWRAQKDTTYTFSLNKEELTVKVVMMRDFITLGWEEYATLGKYYPGGWTTPEALFCVADAYDLSSENFQISYLAHEGRHYADFQLFPNLQSADLEYRAKLTELSLGQTGLLHTLQFFINNANYDSNNGHSVANYCVIRDLSKVLFKNDFEKDFEKWKQLKPKKINKAALAVLKQNTKALKAIGPGVERYIKD